MTEAGAKGQGFCRKCPKTDAIACIFKALCGITHKQKVFFSLFSMRFTEK